MNTVQPEYLRVLANANSFVGDPEHWQESTLTELLQLHERLVAALKFQVPSLVKATGHGIESFTTVAYGSLTTCFLIGYYAAKSEQPQYKN